MKKILLVDDSATMLMSMEAILKRAGLDVAKAMNGQQALQTIPVFRPD